MLAKCWGMLAKGFLGMLSAGACRRRPLPSRGEPPRLHHLDHLRRGDLLRHLRRDHLRRLLVRRQHHLPVGEAGAVGKQGVGPPDDARVDLLHHERGGPRAHVRVVLRLHDVPVLLPRPVSGGAAEEERRQAVDPGRERDGVELHRDARRHAAAGHAAALHRLEVAHAADSDRIAAGAPAELEDREEGAEVAGEGVVAA
eukprot:gene5010-biopygen12583